MKYEPALDGLRAVAVLVVLAFHCKLPFLKGGFIGVDVFFVLSGYLITSLLTLEAEREGRIALGRFYWRRMLRLWPPLLLMLVAYSALAPMVFPEANTFVDVLIAGFYLSDYSRAFWRTPEYLSHTWSLAVEEHFYLIWPVVVLLLVRLGRARAAKVLGVAFVVATAWRMIDAIVWQDWYRTYYRFDTRGSGLLIGAAIAQLSWRPSKQQADGILLASVAVLLGVLPALYIKSMVTLTVVGLLVDLAATGLVLCLAAGHKSVVSSLLEWPPLVRLGLWSYSIYLWHYPISRALRDQMDPVATLLITAPVSIALAALTFELVEGPIKAYRQRALSPA
ncbi:acyltransferase family protein [Aminobacter sp. HY435]|uniref:acyltransferase family protein n=1 Tax=Aminobacter sp. HY435 TaxID=2970917 RepID=UPI0022B9834B|nr:acyltransferase [Aminobacter sp. HY435]